MLAFAPYDLWAAAPFSVALLTLAVRGAPLRLSALVGLAAGLGLFVPLMHWTGVYVGPVPWLFLAAYQAAYVVPLAVGSTLVQRLRWWPLWVACLWVTEEALRSRWFFEGFTWGRLAFSQVDGPVLGLAVLGGAPLMTFAVALAGALIAAGVLAASRAPGRVAGAAFAGAAAVLAVGALVPPANPVGAERGRGGHPGQRAETRSGLQQPARGRSAQPRGGDADPRRRRGRRDPAAAGSRDLAGERLGRRPPARPGGRCPHPGSGRRHRRPGAGGRGRRQPRRPVDHPQRRHRLGAGHGERRRRAE